MLCFCGHVVQQIRVVCCCQPVIVNVAVDVSPQHHSLIIGQAGHSLQQMIQRTGGTIQFPSHAGVSDTQHRGTVYISGTLNSVCTARQLLLVADLFCFVFLLLIDVPSLLRRCWLGGRKGIRPVKN